MSEPRFRLPDAERPQPGWGLVGIAAHVVAFALLAAFVGRQVVRSETQIILFDDRAVDLPGLPGATPVSGPVGLAGSPDQPAADSGSAVVAVIASPRVVPIPAAPRSIVKHDAVMGKSATIGAGYGSGRLWVSPLEGRLGVVGASPDAATHAARVDSAVRAKILAFIDSMPPDSFAIAALPGWTTEIDGKKWGVDGSWIYLGDLKIPSALLALIPMPQGNYYQAKEAAELQAVREQIIRAARQAETNADFRRYVREIRKRKDEEREARLRQQREVTQRTPRDTIPDR